jgi:hypothetical protein
MELSISELNSTLGKRKLVKLSRAQRRKLSKNVKLRGVKSNPKGGWLVETILTDDEFEVFRKKGQGLYAWVTKTQYNHMIKRGLINEDWIKFGQYGALNNNKTPHETITSEYRLNESIVILWAYRFTDEDITNITEKYKDTDIWKVGPAYVVEQIVNKKITNTTPKSDGSGKETFWTSLPIIIREVQTELNKEQLLIPFISSEDKEEAINKMIHNPTKYFGLFATMRHGKSWDYLEYIKRKYVKNNIFENHGIFCHDTKTYGGWKKKIEKSYKDCINLIELKDNKDYDFSKTPTKNTVILISPQLISASSDSNGITNFEEKLKSLKASYNIQLENIFVDEAHNYFTPQWERYYDSILKSGQIILASGTAANLILKHQDKFDEENTFVWGIKELKDRLLEELNIELKLEVKLIQLKNSDGSDFNIANLQSEDDGVLSNQYHFEEFVGKMINPNSKFSPIFSKRKHHIVLLDTVKACKEFKRIIESSKYSDKIVPILVAGPKDRDANSEEELNKLIHQAESEDKRTITLTCGSMIQGVSERNWKSIINLSSKSTYEIYFQLFGRGFHFDKDIDNYIGKGTKKERVIMWDYNPQRIYSVGAEFVDSMAKVNGGNQTDVIKYFYDIIDITEFIEVDGAKGMWSNPKSYEEIESKINEIVNKNTIRRGLTINTCFHKSFDIAGLSSNWIEWAIKQKWTSNGKNGRELRKEKLDLWDKNLLKQKTDHSKSQKDKTQRQTQKEILELQEQVKRSIEQTLNKLDIVWAVYKSQNKVDYHIDELFEYYHEDEFLNGLGLPNKEVSSVFVEVVKRFGLIDKINGKLKYSRIETIENFINMDIETFLKTCDNTIDKWFNYDGDNTQLSVRDAYVILKRQLKNIKATVGQKFIVKNAKSGAINLALTYLLKEKSKEIFGKQLTNQQIIESVSYEEENIFFDSLINTMGFTKTTQTKKDFIIINPPYSSGLHLDIFVKSFNDELNDGGTLICVHRETPVITKTPKPNKKTKKYRNIMLNNTSEITFFDGNKVFNTAQFFAPLIISKVKKDANKSSVKINSNHLKSPYSYEVSDFNDVFIHSNVEKTIRIRKKLLDKIDTEQLSNFNEMSTKKIKNSPYYVNIKQIGGHGMVDGKINKDFYCLVSPKFEYDLHNQITDNINNCLTKAGRGGGIRANSYYEAVNIFEFMKTKSARFFISLTKIDQNIWDGDMLSVIPYLDFSKEWNDDTLFEYFELEDDLIEYINEYIEPIYDYEKSK